MEKEANTKAKNIKKTTTKNKTNTANRSTSTTKKNTTSKSKTTKSSTQSKPKTSKSASTKASSVKKTTVTKKVTPKEEVVVKKEEVKKADKNAILLMIITIIFLLLLIVSASFAYFLVSAENKSKTTKINVEAGDVGSVAFNSVDGDLTLNLTAAQMLQLGKDVTYYASKNGTTTTETTENMGIISVAGAGTFDCTYTMEIKATAKSDDTNMYTKFQNMSTKSDGQIVLTINTQEGAQVYDFNTTSLFPITYNGKATGLNEDNSETISAQLKLTNKTGVVQDDLKGTDITLSVSVSTFSCEIVG